MRFNWLAGCSAVALLSGVAHAQSGTSDSSGPGTPAAPAPGPSAAGAAASAAHGDSPEAGVIIVTANKRAQNLQQVPIAVTAVSEDRLKSVNVTNITNISAVAPSIVFVPAPNPNAVQFVVRGIGTFAFADTLEQSVGVAIDGVPLGRIAGAAVDAVDIQRIEVLRGPQGTVFGKSATAGVISIVTNKANLGATEFAGRFYGGQHDEYRAQGTANIPLIDDRLAIRVSAWDFRHDGYLTAPNQQPDQKVGDMENKGARLRVGLQVTPDWRIDLGAEIAKNWNDGLLQTTRAYESNDLISVPGGISIAQINAQEGLVPGPKNTMIGSEAALGGYVKPQFYTLESNWNLGGSTITFLNGYRRVHSRQIGEFDYSDSRPNSFQTYQRYESQINQFTSELRIASANKSRLQYTAGLFFYDLKVPYSVIEQTYKNNPGLTAATNYASGRRLTSRMDTKNYAGYADVNYSIGKLKLIGGARVSHEDSSGGLIRGLPMDGAPAEGNLNLYIPGQAISGFGPLNVQTQVHYTDFSWRGGLQFQFDRDVMAYATASRAYKGPGFNFGNDVTQAIFDATKSIVKPEIAHSYEIGLRSQFFDRTVTLNLSAYYSTFQNFQITAALPGANGAGLNYTIINAKELKSKGAEVEFGWHPRGALAGLTFDGNASYTDAYYSNFANAPCYLGQPHATAPTSQSGVCAPVAAGSTAFLQSVKGLRAVGAPKYQLNLFLGYDHPVSDRLNGFAQIHYFSQSSEQLGVGNNPLTVVPGYHTVDLSFGVRSANDRWRFSVIGRNVFNKFFITRLVTNNPGLEQVVPYEALSSWGAAVDFKF